MGLTRMRGTKEQRIAEAWVQSKPDMRGACRSDSSDQVMRRIIPVFQEMDGRYPA